VWELRVEQPANQIDVALAIVHLPGRHSLDVSLGRWAAIHDRDSCTPTRTGDHRIAGVYG